MDRPDHRPAELDQGHRDGHGGEPAQEIRGPVERVDHPPAVAGVASGLFAHDGDVRGCLGEHHRDGPLARTVDLGDVVAGSLALGGDLARALEDDPAAGEGRPLGRGGQAGEVERPGHGSGGYQGALTRTTRA